MSERYTIKHGRKTLYSTGYDDALELARRLVKDSTCCATIQDPRGKVLGTLDPDPLPEHHEHGGPDEDSFATCDELVGEEDAV